MSRSPQPLTVNILTLFPELVEASFSHSILKRARTKGLFQPRIFNIREFSRDKHRTVDDKPYGGGSGMVMKIGPIARALSAVQHSGGTGTVYMLTPTGATFNQERARIMAKAERFTLICGRYEGVDQRVEEKLCDESISIGDYVLSGGEPAAVVIVDTIVRLIPTVLGSEDSAEQDSFSDGLLDYPHYTRPPQYRSWRVPEVLLSGDHQKLSRWRRENQLARTLRHRPDLIKNEILSRYDREVLEKLKTAGKSRKRMSRRFQA